MSDEFYNLVGSGRGQAWRCKRPAPISKIQAGFGDFCDLTVTNDPGDLKILAKCDVCHYWIVMCDCGPKDEVDLGLCTHGYDPKRCHRVWDQ